MPEASCQERLPHAWPDDVQSKTWGDLKTFWNQPDSMAQRNAFRISPCGFDLSTSRMLAADTWMGRNTQKVQLRKKM